MPHVVALYRYPVKGFTPEECESLTVLPSGRVAGDRVLAFRFADAPPPDESGWLRKTNYAVLANTPGVARAALRFDEARQRLTIRFPDGRTVEAGLDEVGRAELCHAVALFVITQTDSPVHGHPERLPLTLMGDLAGQHFHDTAAGRVTLHTVESLKALGEAMYEPDLDGRRFRTNIVVEGASAWEELGWVGKSVRIGPADPPLPLREDEGAVQSLPKDEGRWIPASAGMTATRGPSRASGHAGNREGPSPASGHGPSRASGHAGVAFEVVKGVTRCLATHANPVTGERDCDVMNALTRLLGHEKPTFAVSMQPLGGGEVRVGDEVAVS